MQITFEGHSCFTVISRDTTILIDPFISGNPLCTKKPASFRPDIILVTHGHRDHVGDAVEIATACGATLAGPVELITLLNKKGLKTRGFNHGGFDFSDLRLIMTAACHSSAYIGADNKQRYAGLACGYIIDDGEKRLYHAGDTALFGDMQTVIAPRGLDCALLPIGDTYTMGPDDALLAAHWLHAGLVVPMHYNTFPDICQDAAEFARRVEEKTDSHCCVMNPGDTLKF